MLRGGDGPLPGGGRVPGHSPPPWPRCGRCPPHALWHPGGQRNGAGKPLALRRRHGRSVPEERPRPVASGEQVSADDCPAAHPRGVQPAPQRAPSHTAPCGLQSRALHCSRRVFPWPPLGRFFAKVIGEVPRGLPRPVLIGRTPVTRGHAAPAGPVRNSHARSRPRPQLQKPVWGYFRILVSAPRIVWSPHEGTATTGVCGPQDTHSRQPIAPLAGPAVRLLPLLGTEWPVTLQAAGGRCGARGMPHVPGRGAFATAPCGARGQMAGPSTPPSALTELPHPDCPSRTPQGKLASLAGDSSPPECRAGFKAHVHSAAAVGGFPRSVVRVGSTLRKADT